MLLTVPFIEIGGKQKITMALIYYTQDFWVYKGTRDQPMPGPFPAPPIF